MRLHTSLSLLLAIAISAFAQNPKPVTDRLAAQNALFEEQYESDLRNSPERATGFGDYRYNDKLSDYSLAAIAQRHKTDEDFLKRLQAIPTAGFSDQDTSLTIFWFVRSSSASPISISKNTRCR